MVCIFYNLYLQKTYLNIHNEMAIIVKEIKANLITNNFYSCGYMLLKYFSIPINSSAEPSITVASLPRRWHFPLLYLD